MTSSNCQARRATSEFACAGPHERVFVVRRPQQVTVSCRRTPSASQRLHRFSFSRVLSKVVGSPAKLIAHRTLRKPFMIVSWNWLQEYVDLKIPVRELTDRLTMAGLNLESFEPVGADTAIDVE